LSYLFKKGDFVKKKYLIKVLLFTGIGALAGFTYYYFIGCNSGSCPIQSSPYISTAYGSTMGFILSLGKNKKEE